MPENKPSHLENDSFKNPSPLGEEYSEQPENRNVTSKLGGRPPQYNNIKAPDNLDNLIQELETNNVLFLTCTHWPTLHAAGYSVIESANFSDESIYTRRFLGGDLLQGLDVPTLFNNRATVCDPNHPNDPTIVLVDLNDNSFFNSFRGNMGFIQNQRVWLKEGKIAFIFLVHPDTLELAGGTFDFEDYVNCHRIPSPTQQNAKTGTELASPLPTESETYTTIIRSGRPAEQAALFLAAFFRRLPRRDFEDLMEILLTGQEERIKQEAEETTSEGQSAEEKWTWISVPAIDYWHNSKAELREMLAVTLEGRGLTRTIGLKNERIEQEVCELMWDDGELPIIFYQRIDQARLVFREELPQGLQQRILVVTRTIAEMEPSEFGTRWLHDLVRAFNQELAEKFNIETQGGSLLSMIATEHVTSELKSWFYWRLGNLCLTLYELQDTRNSIDELLEKLFTQTDYESVRRLIDKLKDIPDFNYNYWIDRLLANGSNEIRLKVINQLALQAIRSGERCELIVRRIFTRVPPPDKPIDSYSHEELCCIYFILLLFQRVSTIYIRNNRLGKNVQFTLLGKNSPNPTKNWLELLREWLCHRGLSSAVRFLNKERDLSQIYADVLDDWFEAATRALGHDKLAREFTQSILKSVSPKELIAIKGHWKSFEAHLSRRLKETLPIGETADLHRTLKSRWERMMTLTSL